MIIDLLNKHHVFIYKSKPENTSTLAHFISAVAVTTQFFFSQSVSRMQKGNERTILVEDRMF